MSQKDAGKQAPVCNGLRGTAEPAVLAVLNGSQASIHPQACPVCLMSYWQATGTRVPVPRGKHTFHRL